jgi:hypothetical protein
LVGPEGKVFAIDLVPQMVAAARQAAHHLPFRADHSMPWSAASV